MNESTTTPKRMTKQEVIERLFYMGIDLTDLFVKPRNDGFAIGLPVGWKLENDSGNQECIVVNEDRSEIITNKDVLAYKQSLLVSFNNLHPKMQIPREENTSAKPEYLPLDTAPKDGTRVYLYGTYRDDSRLMEVKGFYKTYFEHGWVDINGNWFDATSWRPVAQVSDRTDVRPIASSDPTKSRQLPAVDTLNHAFATLANSVDFYNASTIRSPTSLSGLRDRLAAEAEVGNYILDVYDRIIGLAEKINQLAGLD